MVGSGDCMSNEGKKPIKIEKGKKPIIIEKNHKLIIKPNFKGIDNINLKKFVICLVVIIILVVGSVFVSSIFVPSIEKIKDSVVKINIYDEDGNYLGNGSGFCAYKSNYIITNFHVVENAYKLEIVTDNKDTYDVNNVIIFDPNNDLAILDTDVNLKPLKLGKTNKISAGSKVTAIGSPLGELNTVSTGVVSNAENDRGIQISAAISPGSSGGVLLNKKNKVIGITYLRLRDGQNLNYAINVEMLNDLYKAYTKEKYELLTISDYDRCMPSSSNKLKFENCYNNDFQYYSSNNYNTFYEITNHQNRYEYQISEDSWGDFYNDLSETDKKLALEYFEELVETSFCEESCNISQDIDKWDVNDFIINLNILEKHELAFVLVDIENYSNDAQKFNRVNDYYIGAAEKALILYLIGDRDWNNIHKDNKEDIFDYFDEKYDTEDMGAILEVLGYRVEYTDDGLTAWW